MCFEGTSFVGLDGCKVGFSLWAEEFPGCKRKMCNGQDWMLCIPGPLEEKDKCEYLRIIRLHIEEENGLWEVLQVEGRKFVVHLETLRGSGMCKVMKAFHLNFRSSRVGDYYLMRVFY